MKEKIQEAVRQLKQRGNTAKTISFSHRDATGEKSVKGSVSLKKDGKISLALKEINGYSEKYVTTRARTFLLKSLLDTPSSGQTIWTRFDPGGLVVGSVYTIRAGRRYFGIGGAVSDCNGRPLPQDWQARYLRTAQDFCDGLGRYYTLFQLL